MSIVHQIPNLTDGIREERVGKSLQIGWRHFDSAVLIVFVVIGGLDMAAGVSTPAQHQAQCGASVWPLAYSTTAAYLTIYYSLFTIYFFLPLCPASNNKINLLVAFLSRSE